ncbi:MAG: shikimate kinase [Burkholderiales bacterium]
MMGAGKTTVGKLIARRLKRRFVDSDQEIERRCGVRISVVFDIEGERGFRAREEQAIGELATFEGVVLATGGGAVLSPENRRQLALRGTTVYLHARPEDLFRRLRHDKNRPLLDTPDPAQRLKELYAQRDPLYRQVADIVIETGTQSVQALARDLLAKIEEKCKVSA